MKPDDDLARWGEPPADEGELALAELLGEALERGLDGAPLPDDTLERIGESPAAGSLLEVCRWIDEMIGTVLERSGVFENLPPPADAGGQAGGGVELRLSVSRLSAGRWHPVASTRARPCVVRDLRRVPDDPDRVALRTGERVRVEVVCDRPGYLAVFNVGPRGGLNLLYPDAPGQPGPIREHDPILIANVELTPPAGRERVYAVWSGSPAPVRQLAGLVHAGAALRDLKRVQEGLAGLRPEDWHAVLLELDHRD